MSRRVSIDVLCDPCGAEDVESPGSEWLIEVQGQRLVVDLCEQHVESWGLTPLAAQLSKYGRAPERPGKAPRPVKAPQPPDQPRPFACTEPDCGKAFTTAQGLRMHGTRTHSPSGAAWGHARA